MNQEIVIAILGGTGAMLGWGVADFLAKKTIDKIGNLKTLFWMQVFGSIPLLVYFLLTLSTPGVGFYFSFTNLFSLIFLALIDAFAYLFFYKALEKGQVSIVSPLLSSFAALAVIISAFWFKEQILAATWLLLGIIFLGIILTSINFQGLKDGSLHKKDLVKGLPETLGGHPFCSFLSFL